MDMTGVLVRRDEDPRETLRMHAHREKAIRGFIRKPGEKAEEKPNHKTP